MARIREIMEQDAYICNEKDTIETVVKFLATKKISGVPVVNDKLHVVGFISDGDIMEFVSRKKPVIFDFQCGTAAVVDDQAFEEKLEELMEMNVMQLATKRVLAADVNDEVDKVAELLARKHIKKVPVLEDGVLKGVVSRSTIVRHIFWKMLHSYGEIE